MIVMRQRLTTFRRTRPSNGSRSLRYRPSIGSVDNFAAVARAAPTWIRSNAATRWARREIEVRCEEVTL